MNGPPTLKTKMLDATDWIVDHTTLMEIIHFLDEQVHDTLRIDCQFTTSNGLVVMHHWQPETGAGVGESQDLGDEDGNGLTNSIIRQVTARRDGEEWNGVTSPVIKYNLGGMGMMIRCPVDAILEEAGSEVLDQPMVTYHFDTESKAITTDKETAEDDSDSDSDSGDESSAASNTNTNLIDRFQFTIIKASVMKPKDIESIYLQLLLSQLDTCLTIALPDEDGNVLYENANRTLYNIDDPIFNQARIHMDPLVEQAISLCKDMIRLTRLYGMNTSYVGEAQAQARRGGELEKGNDCFQYFKSPRNQQSQRIRSIRRALQRPMCA